MAYFWGESMGPEELGKAMLAVRCVRGMHLDMNTKHTGFEFYRPFAPGSAPPDLGRKLAEGEAQGPIEQGLGFTFRTRLAVKTMSPLRFPRYLARDPRDYFFLTLKSVLPGPAITHRRAAGRVLEQRLAAGRLAGRVRARARRGRGRASRAPATEPGSCASTRRARCRRRWLRPSSIARSPGCTGLPPAAEASGRLALYATRAHGVLRYRVGTPPRGREHRRARRRAGRGHAGARARSASIARASCCTPRPRPATAPCSPRACARPALAARDCPARARALVLRGRRQARLGRRPARVASGGRRHRADGRDAARRRR